MLLEGQTPQSGLKTSSCQSRRPGGSFPFPQCWRPQLLGFCWRLPLPWGPVPSSPGCWWLLCTWKDAAVLRHSGMGRRGAGESCGCFRHIPARLPCVMGPSVLQQAEVTVSRVAPTHQGFVSPLEVPWQSPQAPRWMV